MFSKDIIDNSNIVILKNCQDIGKLGLIKQMNSFFSNTKIFKNNLKVLDIEEIQDTKNPNNDLCLTLSGNVKDIDFNKSNKIFPDLVKVSNYVNNFENF